MGGRSRRSTLQAWGYYLLALTAWVTIVLVVSVLGFIICRSLIWYETNPLYHLLNWVRDYYFFVFAFVILVVVGGHQLLLHRPAQSAAPGPH